MALSDSEFDRKYTFYDSIAKANNLKTVWSDFSIEDFNQVFGFISDLKYLEVCLEVNKEVTYLELWKLAEKLILITDDWGHYFIESFNPIKNKPSCYEMFTGS